MPLTQVLMVDQTCGHDFSVPWIPPESPGRPLLAVMGLDAYLWSQQPGTPEKQQLEHPGGAGPEVAVDWPQTLVILQLWAGLDVLLVDSWPELAQHVCAFTRALAQSPFKGRWAGSQRVARDGTGLRETWRRKIEQLNQVSPAVVEAVVSASPSQRLLQQAYSSCSREQQCLGLLAELCDIGGEGAWHSALEGGLRPFLLHLSPPDPY